MPYCFLNSTDCTRKSRRLLKTGTSSNTSRPPQDFLHSICVMCSKSYPCIHVGGFNYQLQQLISSTKYLQFQDVVNYKMESIKYHIAHDFATSQAKFKSLVAVLKERPEFNPPCQNHYLFGQVEKFPSIGESPASCSTNEDQGSRRLTFVYQKSNENTLLDFKKMSFLFEHLGGK
ncbi:unnamed protein product [Candida parapsilosis]